MSRMVTLVLLISLSVAGEAAAQNQWGLSVGLTPSWHTGEPIKYLFRADQVIE